MEEVNEAVEEEKARYRTVLKNGQVKMEKPPAGGFSYIHTMKHQIRNITVLKKVLWADVLLGGSTALAGLIWHVWLAAFLGLPVKLVLVIAAVTLAYALLALSLAIQSRPFIPLLRALICANWVWTVISLGMLIFYFSGATPFGVLFLILQVAVVGGLAYFEGRHVVKL